MERIAASCKKCNSKLGDFINLWTKVGKSYISPIVNAGDDDLSVVLTGSVRTGEKQTLVDHCQLQDVACSQCRSIIGIQCLETPVNHILHGNQVMLRLTSVVTTATDSQVKVQPNIQRTLKLRSGPSKNSHASDEDASSSRDDAYTRRGPGNFFGQDDDGTPLANDGTNVTTIQADLDAQRQDIERIDSAGYQVVSAFDNAILRIEGEVKKLKDGLSSVVRDIQGHQSRAAAMERDASSLRGEVIEVVLQSSRDTSKFAKLEDEINAAKRTIVQVREEIVKTVASNEERRNEHDATKLDLDRTRMELKALRKELEETRSIAKEGVAMAKGYAKDTLSLRAEVVQLKEELARDRSRKQSPSDGAFPTRELDILTSNITKIGNRASQVEGLQMELQLLKGRVQRLETRSTAAENDGNGSRLPDQAANHQTLDSRTVHHQLEPGRKRGSSSLRVEEILESESSFSPPAKRQINWSSSPLAHYESASSPPSMVSLGASPSASRVVRLTKSGAVDRRYSKRSLARATTKNGAASG